MILSLTDFHLYLYTVAGIAVFAVLMAIFFRVVVSTNDVHIVQSTKKTTSYGKDQPAGNTYYKWPSWVPIIGVKTISLPVSVFDQDLSSYAAYDKGRVPFVIDIMAFFRIVDSNMAAQRIHSFEELREQLKSILQGAVRTILASSEIEEILEGRSRFGEMFTREVDGQLSQWGVQTVKSIELMDIRDAEDSQVIANIMAKKKSLIEMQSRVEVANNKKIAQEAEIAAQRDVDLRSQEALQQVGIRTAEKEREVGIANEKSQQQIKDEAKITAEKTMAVQQVQDVRAAEIQRDVKVVEAERDKRTTVLKAEGDLEAQRRSAEGIQVEGQAKAEAEKAMQLAPVEAQISLAKEIGTNEGYQRYLIAIRQIEAGQEVGSKQAEALIAADVKIISNAANPVDGANGVMGLFTPQGGLQLGAMLEAFTQTDAGKAAMSVLRPNPPAPAEQN